jgi:hypothetical protein
LLDNAWFSFSPSRFISFHRFDYTIGLQKQPECQKK